MKYLPPSSSIGVHQWLKNLLCTAVITAAVAIVGAGRPARAENVAEKPRRPNIVVILADDLGWSDLGCFGGEIPTPQIDSLAAGGLRFTQFYNNAVCGPSRASLLTGLYAQRIGHSGAHWNQPTDYTRCITIGEGLQRAGYHTMAVGKWQDPDLPAKRGFDRFFGPMCAGKISYFHEVAANPYYLDEQRVSLPDDFYLTDALTDYAIQFLDEAAQRPETNRQPFFLYVAHIAPHWPLHAREAEIAPHRARYRELGWNEVQTQRRRRQSEMKLVPDAWRPAPRPEEIQASTDDAFHAWQAERMAVYAAQVAALDRSTGRILEAIRRRGDWENTLVLFLSDHGAAPDGGLTPSDRMLGFAPGLSTNGTWRRDGVAIRPGSGPHVMPGPADTFAAYGLAWALTSNTPFRSTKMTGYEGGIRTPLIAHWPQGIAAQGRLCGDVGHVIDLMPTCLELAGASYATEQEGRRPLPLDGKSLVPLFQQRSRVGHKTLAWRVPLHHVFREGDWKIIRPNGESAWELYDLKHDGTETDDLAQRRPEIVERLAAKWSKWSDDAGRTP